MSELYRQQIIDRSRNPQYGSPLAHPTHQGEGANLSCGDEISWEMEVNETGSIVALAHQTRACAICAASADLLAEHAIGKPYDTLNTITPKDIQRLLGDLPLSPVRLKCALLPLETLRGAVRR